MFIPFKKLLNKRSLSARMGVWGLVIILCYLLAALLSPILISWAIVPQPDIGIENPIFSPPSFTHWCGTDRLGRDVCSRTISATSVALEVVVLAVSLAVLIGVPLGMLSGYIGGFLDRFLVLVMDTLYTVPVLLLSVVMAFLLGKGIPNAAFL